MTMSRRQRKYRSSRWLHNSPSPRLPHLPGGRMTSSAPGSPACATGGADWATSAAAMAFEGIHRGRPSITAAMPGLTIPHLVDFGPDAKLVGRDLGRPEA